MHSDRAFSLLFGDSKDPEAVPKSSRHLIATYLESGEPYFRQYDDIEKVASMISVDEIKRGTYLHVFAGVTDVRAALMMARIQLFHLGNVIKAREFAAVGLENIGGATLLRRDLESILAMES